MFFSVGFMNEDIRREFGIPTHKSKTVEENESRPNKGKNFDRLSTNRSNQLNHTLMGDLPVMSNPNANQSLMRSDKSHPCILNTSNLF